MADLSVAIRLSATDQASPVIGKVTREVAGIGSAADTSSSKVGGLTSVLGKVGLAAMGIGAVATAVAGVGRALVDPIMAASDLDESMNKVNVVFGTSAKTVTDFAKTAAQGLGTSQSEALAAAGTFGNLFTSMGLGRQEAAKLSTNILTLGADLASFNNVDPAEALEKLRAGLVGEAEPLRALGVNINEASVADEALRLGLAKSKKEISDSAKVQARYSLIMKQTTNAQGDFKNTSSGMANSIRIIKASFADLQTQIGSRLLPIIAPLVSGFAKMLPAALDALGPVLDRVGGFARNFADGLGRLVENVRTKGLLPALGELGREILPTLQQAFTTAGDLAGSIVSWLRDQVGRIDWAGIWAGAKNVGAGLVARLGDIASQVTAWLAQQWSRIEWGGVWKSVTGFATGLADGLGDVWRLVTTWVSGQWAKIDWDAVWKSVQGHGAALVKALAPITEDVQAWLVAQVSAVDWDRVWATAQAGREASRSLVDLIDATDASPLGDALGRYLVRAGKAAVAFAFSPGGAWAGASALAAAAFVLEMVSFPTRILGALQHLIVTGLRGAFEGAVDELGLSSFANSLAAKVKAAIGTIFPIQVGPLTIGLGSVSLDVSGLARTVRGLGGEPTPGLTREPGGRDVYTNARGGLYRVAGGGGTDSQMVAFRATPGEVVAVGQRRGRLGGGGAVTINLGGVHVHDQADEERLVARLRDEVEGYLTGGLRAARHRGVRFPLGVGAGAT